MNNENSLYTVSVQFNCSGMSDSVTPMDCSTPDFPVHHQLLELAQTHVHRVGDTIQPFHPLSSPSPPQDFPASGCFPVSKLFASGGQSIGVSASPSLLLMNIHSRFPLGWIGLISLQGTLKSLLQHHSLKASILWCSAIFIIRLSHAYMTTGKTIALTR